ncbi:MAG TPA: hypothetical protein VGP47_10685, partial [Parachlamydiaceae bacterium]|nr:hypothetical protein [Parachlamydiaceae bacterium]
AKLANYSANQKVYYSIKVIERASEPEILTFAEAEQDGVLETLLDKKLEASYAKIRDQDPKAFKKEDQSWKEFEDVKDAVATRHFSKILDAIQSSYSAATGPDAKDEKMIPDYAATLRFYPYVNDLKARMQKDPAQIAVLTQVPMDAKADVKVAHSSLADQWKLERAPYKTSRSGADSALDHLYVFNLSGGDWTKVNTPANGDINFFHVSNKGNGLTDKTVAESVVKARHILSDDVQQRLMQHVLQTIQDKGAISLDYLKKVAEIDQMSTEEGY